MNREVDIQDWDRLRAKNLKRKKKIIVHYSNEYDTYHDDNDYEKP